MFNLLNSGLFSNGAIRARMRKNVLKALLTSDEYFEKAMIRVLQEQGYDIKKKPERQLWCPSCRDYDTGSQKEPCNTCLKMSDDENRRPLWKAKVE